VWGFVRVTVGPFHDMPAIAATRPVYQPDTAGHGNPADASNTPATIARRQGTYGGRGVITTDGVEAKFNDEQIRLSAANQSVMITGGGPRRFLGAR
jgi:hypothetical protein